MAKTTYSNSNNPNLFKWIINALYVIIIAVTIIFCIRIFVTDWESGLDSILVLVNSALAFLILFLTHKLISLTIDEEADLVTLNQIDSLKISELSSIQFVESKRGRFRFLYIRDNSKQFIKMRTSERQAQAIVEHLTRLNPVIEVKHTNGL